MVGLQAPVLKWAYGGCHSSWCETGWYSSPAVADINGDGKNEIIASAYSLVALNGTTGALIWRKGGTKNRTWPYAVTQPGDGYISASPAMQPGKLSGIPTCTL